MLLVVVSMNMRIWTGVLEGLGRIGSAVVESCGLDGGAVRAREECSDLEQSASASLRQSRARSCCKGARSELGKLGDEGSAVADAVGNHST